MTDFHLESSWIEHPSSGADFWESSRPAPIQEQHASRPSGRARRRPAAALAAGVHELLESMARKRVPRLDAARQRLQDARGGVPMLDVEDALHAMHAATAGVDFLAGRNSLDRAEFTRQGQALAEAIGKGRELLGDFLRREAVGAPIARLVWVDLVFESGSLRKRVRQGAHWLAEMDQDLLYRRKHAGGAVALRAIEELARRGVTMHERLQTVHRLCGEALTVHALSEELAAQRAALWATLRERVLPACKALDDAVQPLLHAAGYRALVPTELLVAVDACHALQVELTQAGAQILRLRALDQELGTQLGSLEERSRALTS
jgi:hypothetical protein